jgi:hypothetical protein
MGRIQEIGGYGASSIRRQDRGFSKFAPAAATRSFEVEYLSPQQVEAAFPGQLRHFSATRPGYPRSADSTVFSALQSIGMQFSTLRQQRHLSIGQKLDFAYQSIASSKLPCAA